jgi:hypothetical protein
VRFSRAFAVALLVAMPSVAWAKRDRDEPVDVHLAIAAGWTQLRVVTVTTADFVPLCPSGTSCDVAPSSTQAMFGEISLGYRRTSVEGTVTHAPGLGVPLLVFHGGLRIDTSARGVFGLFFRMGYVRRWGVFEGRGGRLGAGLVVRPVEDFEIFADAAVDVTSVSESMNVFGALFSYSVRYGAGLRLVFGK